MRAPARRTTDSRAGRSRRLRRAFYDRPTLVVAKELLGKVLVHRTPEGVTAGRIVEVEAYIGEDDPACHAAPGPTPRNRPLYGPPGFSYVYLNYGMHCLTNVVTEPKGSPAAVLLRALEPLEGIDLMRRRRARAGAAETADADLCRGPGNLSRAMGITLAQNWLDLVEGDGLYLEDRGGSVGPIAWSTRIGIRVGADRPWRCFVRDSPAVSGSRRLNGNADSREGAKSIRLRRVRDRR
ncbi:MAG TPA: DNA-3-methyladenine glycosylase [Vicinamibacterales bacterium]|nr:DNA-3-methyladenine glycosylase [Vicinamibacterales bacterium]